MQQNKRPLLIGITGNIGSGKSTASQIIRKTHTLISADEIVSRLLKTPELKAKLKTRYGERIFCDNDVNRKALADIVFQSKTEIAFLNNLLHPLVLQEFSQIVSQSDSQVLFFEVPLLFEANLQNCFDFLILVYCDPKLRLQRLARRDNTSQREISRRLNQQIPDESKLDSVDIVMANNEGISSLENQVTAFLSTISSIRQKLIVPFQSLSI